MSVYTCSSVTMLALCAVATCAVASATTPSGIDYCSSRQSEEPAGGRVEWSTKTSNADVSPVMHEFVVDAHSKSLHCCGRGYRTIEWYKDEQAYPWGADVSSFILYPEAANQTVYTRRADGAVDRGRYTCRMSNATHARRHTVTLHVVESTPSEPRATIAPGDHLVELGSSVRIYCEAFIVAGRSECTVCGCSRALSCQPPLKVYIPWTDDVTGDFLHRLEECDIKLPDAYSDIWWWRVDKPDPERPLNQEKVLRSEGQVMGAWLVLESVTESDYGAYACSARNAEHRIDMPIQLHHKLADPRLATESLRWRAALAGSGAALALLALLAVYRGRRARGHSGDDRGKLSGDVALQDVQHDNDADADADVALAYLAADAEVCLRLLRPALVRRFRYSVRPLPMSADTDRWSSMLREAESARALLAVLSPASLSPPALRTALSALRRAACLLPNTKPIVVMLQDVPVDSEVSACLRDCRVLRWRRGPADPRFWLSLRLALPLLPRRDTHTRPSSHDTRAPIQLQSCN